MLEGVARRESEEQEQEQAARAEAEAEVDDGSESVRVESSALWKDSVVHRFVIGS